MSEAVVVHTDTKKTEILTDEAALHPTKPFAETLIGDPHRHEEVEREQKTETSGKEQSEALLKTLLDEKARLQEIIWDQDAEIEQLNHNVTMIYNQRNEAIQKLSDVEEKHEQEKSQLQSQIRTLKREVRCYKRTLSRLTGVDEGPEFEEDGIALQLKAENQIYKLELDEKNALIQQLQKNRLATTAKEVSESMESAGSVDIKTKKLHSIIESLSRKKRLLQADQIESQDAKKQKEMAEQGFVMLDIFNKDKEAISKLAKSDD